MSWPDAPRRPPPGSAARRLQLRVLIVLAAIAVAAFFLWVFQPARLGDAWVYWPLTAAMALMAAGMLLELINYWAIGAPAAARPKRRWTVDVFTTACPGEPREMIVRTLVAMTRISYPHRNYLCDEGDDPLLRAACDELGVTHVTREDRRDAKAGNINNALRLADGEICVILDPDHEPAPYMLDRILGYFEDPRVGFVQSVQAYRNQRESLIARAAAEQTYPFYGPIMMGMHTLGTVQAIGANCAFRREALDSIGGHAAGLAEDMHTAMRLLAGRWRGVYVPEILTRGLAPSTLGAYYRQQLKWSCGVFDLLFKAYPRLCRRFTPLQRLHYLIAPTYFLRGLAVLVGMLATVGCLAWGWVPWRFEPAEFLLWCLPPVILTILVRQAAQSWLAEEAERGFHVLGGLVATGTWWVHVIGFLCACLRIRVPYIPTPKEGEARDSWVLAMPNFLAAGLCVWAIARGIARDCTPFTLVMAAFAAWIASALTAVGLIGQQKTMRSARRLFTGAAALLRPVRAPAARVRLGLLWTLRTCPTAVLLSLLVAGGAVRVAQLTDRAGRSYEMPWVSLMRERDTGGFHTGIHVPTRRFSEAPAAVAAVEERLGVAFSIVSLYQAWGPQSVESFPHAELRAIYRRGGIPMITWEPWTNGFNWPDERADLRKDRRVFAAILDGAFDQYLAAYAEQVRALGEPLILRFAHEMDNPWYPWSAAGGNTAEEFVAAWQYTVNFFKKLGASNVAWVWSPWSPANLDRYFPGKRFVDWIGLTVLNYGNAGPSRRWHHVPELYEPFRRWREDRRLELPVMLAEFGTNGHGGDRIAWLEENVPRVLRDYPEIRALVFFHSDRDANWPTPWRPAEGTRWIDWTFAQLPGARAVMDRTLGRLPPAATTRAIVATDGTLWGDRHPPPNPGPSVVKEQDRFELLVDGAPFYVRGVAYNPGHNWRDGNSLPTRRQVEGDFAQIRAMGANTIRRYGRSWYDRVILDVAAEKGLKVVYGFWLDQEIDYLAGDPRMAEIEAEVEETVRSWRDEPAILGWCIGNEVWGMLHIGFAQPYLTRVRQAHVLFVEGLARRIKELDRRHPVLVAHEHSEELGGCMLDFARGAPSVDANGVNSYYEHHIRLLHETVAAFDPRRPYIVTEFGHDGYWLQFENHRGNLAQLVEVPATRKAAIYARRWEDCVSARRGLNLGGIAYCWRDRFEATATWFGITTLDGRPKPLYYALREAWNGDPAPAGPAIRAVRVPGGPLHPGATLPISVDYESKGREPRVSWRLLGGNFRDAATSIRTGQSGRFAWLRLPREAGVYRLYVEVADEKGIDQSNVPIVVDGARPGDLAASERPIADRRGLMAAATDTKGERER